jgi:predicted nucleic acid-binding protein
VIVVDSSVWIDFFKGVRTRAVDRLMEAVPLGEVLVGDLILCEVLQGVRDEHEAHRIEHALADFDFAAMSEPILAIRAAANFRRLRTLGFTVRNTVDLIIGTFCIERRHVLLHTDRDFEPMRPHLGLETL